MATETTPAIRWRQHEMLLATLVFILSIGGIFWIRFNLSERDIEMLYVEPMQLHGLEFNYARHVIFPQLSIIICEYALYCWLYFGILPRLFGYGRKVRKSRYILCAIQLVALVLFQGFVWGSSLFWQDQDAFMQGAIVHGADRMDEGLRRATVLGMRIAFGLTVGYLALATLREIVIRWIENGGGRRAFRVSMSNKISAFMVFYLALPFALLVYGKVHDDGLYRTYFTLVPGVLAVCLFNIYWIFPMKGEGKLFRLPIVWRLLVVTLVCSMPFAITIARSPDIFIAAWWGLWVMQTLIITPVSWLIYQQHKDSILRLAGLEKELDATHANLQFLRAQINPHFLFNALNTLYGTALQENAARSAEGIQRLGDMMRFMLQENNADWISMEKEIEYLRNYISLQKLRTIDSPAIRIQADIDEGRCDHRIAPMLLIPFVENAFKHGISLREPSWIDIRLYCDEKSICFEVRNSIHERLDQDGRDPEKDSHGIGMKNVLDRLRLLYARRHQFIVNQDRKEYFIQLIIEP